MYGVNCFTTWHCISPLHPRQRLTPEVSDDISYPSSQPVNPFTPSPSMCAGDRRHAWGPPLYYIYMTSDMHTGQLVRYRARYREGARHIGYWVYRRPEADSTLVRENFEPGVLGRVDIRPERPCVRNTALLLVVGMVCRWQLFILSGGIWCIRWQNITMHGGGPVDNLIALWPYVRPRN